MLDFYTAAQAIIGPIRPVRRSLYAASVVGLLIFVLGVRFEAFNFYGVTFDQDQFVFAVFAVQLFYTLALLLNIAFIIGSTRLLLQYQQEEERSVSPGVIEAADRRFDEEQQRQENQYITELRDHLLTNAGSKAKQSPAPRDDPFYEANAEATKQAVIRERHERAKSQIERRRMRSLKILSRSKGSARRWMLFIVGLEMLVPTLIGITALWVSSRQVDFIDVLSRLGV